MFGRAKRLVFGKRHDLTDSRVFSHLSVFAFLAWVGLGADGLSSSSYGPEEAYRTLGEHTYLAVPLALLVMATVFIISACYSRIIERFPHGGGGYLVATALLGERAGVVSGSALLVDYILTITVSIAAAGDALFSFMPPGWQGTKLPVEAGLILGLITINIRGVKESILILLPVFLLFLATHAVLVIGGVLACAPALPSVTTQVTGGFHSGLATLGLGGMFFLFIHAYSLGGGTYTGIEAVSNGLPIMREPRVQTAQRTMIYMALSLAITASGLLFCYLLFRVQISPDKTLNAVLAERVMGGLPFGGLLVILTLFSEGALLVVAAQAGFIDGPRVLANMAIDSWMPRRFATLSERLTTRDGVLLMGLAAMATLLYSHGDVRRLVVMYSINVFLTFSLSMLSMSRWHFGQRRTGKPWKRRFLLFVVGLLFCATILALTTVEKFTEGGWLTLLVTALLVALCFIVRHHYAAMNARLAKLFQSLVDMPQAVVGPPPPLDREKPTAVVMVGGYSGLGIHSTLTLMRMFPGQFKNIVFVSAGVVDSAALREEDPLARLRKATEENLARYVKLANDQGFASTYRMTFGTDVISELEQLCLSVGREFHPATFFAGQLVFQRERWYQPILHNETAFAVQKRLHFAGHTMVILPARVP